LLVHVRFPPHVPHWSVPPQPSAIAPQFLPCAAQVVGVHAGGGGHVLPHIDRARPTQMLSHALLQQ
jgi:hypothetical protein